MKVVGLGGGHGLAATLRAARLYADDIAAVVTVADDGGSSGRLTRELGIPPPGDIRNCLVALADDEATAGLFQHRFASGALTGHTVGNLIIAALTEMTGDFAQAVRRAGDLVGATGDVIPATTRLVDLRAKVPGGVIRGQVAVARTSEPIQSVYLEPPDPEATEAAVEAIATADQVVIGPGSLFTSVIATLLVPGVRDALQRTRAQRVFVCNARMQKGETEDMDAAAHVRALLAHLDPAPLDLAVVHAPEIATDAVEVHEGRLVEAGVPFTAASVASDNGAHIPEKLAAALQAAAQRRH